MNFLKFWFWPSRLGGDKEGSLLPFLIAVIIGIFVFACEDPGTSEIHPPKGCTNTYVQCADGSFWPGTKCPTNVAILKTYCNGK